MIKSFRQKQTRYSSRESHRNITITFAYPEIHSSRLKAFFTFVKSGLRDQRISVTYLGRGLKNDSDTDKKHDIKRADRLIGNRHLHNERLCFY